MSGKSTIEQIKHYQKDIERCPDNTERMLRCIHRLYILPITLQHLQETGIGRSVNSLRKYKGEVGDAAKALVTKWKAMVAAEESGDETQETPSSSDRVVSPPPPPPKSERKHEHQTKKEKSSKEKNSSKECSDSSNNKKISSSVHGHQNSQSKSYEKVSDSKSAKRSHSTSSVNHSSEKMYKHGKHHDQINKSDVENKPPPEKVRKTHHSHSKEYYSKNKEVSSESDNEDQSEESEEDEISDRTPDRDSDNDVNSDSSSESDDSSDIESNNRSKQYNHKHSSHSNERDREKERSKHNEKNRIKDKEKNKENNKHSKHSSKKKYSPDYMELIKENEKKIKKEKNEELMSPPKSAPSKHIKLETNEDGSIDSGSGASFADALLGMDNFDKKKLKKPSNSKSSKGSSSKTSAVIKTEEKDNNKYKPSSSASSTSLNKSIDELVEPPELLTKKVKLEALDLDFSSTLPEINPNYKPLPHVPERRLPKAMSDEDHMFSIMTTKNQRTKVYSGNKVVLTSVPTLFSMCIQLLYENIDAVEYTGGVPFQLLKPLLEKLNAEQLYVLEHFNPYLIDDTDNLWKFHCNKEFRNEKRQDMETWRELYVRCMDEREKKLKALTANITQSMAKSTPVRQAKLAYVDAVVKPPRNIARKQAKFGTGNSSSSKISTKHDIVSKAIVGGNTPGISVKDTVPTPPPVARAAAHHPTPVLLKKKKAPLMQKALQVMKGIQISILYEIGILAPS